jgi:hypothetical protein
MSLSARRFTIILPDPSSPLQTNVAGWARKVLVSADVLRTAKLGAGDLVAARRANASVRTPRHQCVIGAFMTVWRQGPFTVGVLWPSEEMADDGALPPIPSLSYVTLDLNRD